MKDDPDDPMRTAMRQMAGVFAQLERGLVVKRLRDGRATKRANGGWPGGGVPYGLTAAEGALRVDLDEQRVVERVLAMRAAGDSYRVICDALEAEGFRPRRANGWQPMVVLRIVERTE